MRFLIFGLWLAVISCTPKKDVVLWVKDVSPRAEFGARFLAEELKNKGYRVSMQFSDTLISTGSLQIEIGGSPGEAGEEDDVLTLPDKAEAFRITGKAGQFAIAGSDASGVMYGCMELAERLKELKRLPAKIAIADAPEMVMRGTCIGMQKTEYLPGRKVYEYPYTPENFPWFYDKELWVRYLDLLVENRFNALYLWNGHPFASLVKLDDYPYAVEVDDETFRKNEEMFAFLTTEADKRGIFVIQMFYNIIVSQPFAEKHGIKTQERSRPITPLVADYTKKSIAAFIEKYPNVGLLVTLGEAMHTIDDDVEWFTETIIPGVQDGLKALGRTDEPPIVLRGHDTDAARVMEEALPIYKNLYTMFKYNGESLTTYAPRDAWESIPKGLSELGSVHISNVHILANLEPFRYGSPDFIQKSIKAMHEVQGANGLHLYPQASYWDWPYTADNTSPRLLQIDRDWVWYKAWARYAWRAGRDSLEEAAYWADVLGDYYACGHEGDEIVTAYQETGEIAPKLLRTFGISDGNRQTLLLGMFMGQLVNPYKYHVYKNFLTSNGPVGEILIDYAAKEAKGEPHVGETPPQIIAEVVEHGRKALEAIRIAEPLVADHAAEFQRLENDVVCYDLFANYFSEKVKAALLVLEYKYSNDVGKLEQAVPLLERSVQYYRELVKHTQNTYLYANSMQTDLRRIPVTGREGVNKHWEELLPQYETELQNFKNNIENLKRNFGQQQQKTYAVLQPVEVDLKNKANRRYALKTGAKVYQDMDAAIQNVAPELQQLQAVQLTESMQRTDGTTLSFRCQKPVKVLVGYFNTNSYTVLEPPTLETNAQANDRGQADIKIANAMLVDGLYPVNVYTYHYEAGDHELVLGTGRVLILGFIDGNETIQTHDAGISDAEEGVPVDWLFY